MLNIKRVADLEQITLSAALSAETWIEVVRKQTDHHWQPYKISATNFLASIADKLSELKLESETAYQHLNMPLGSVFYTALPCDSTSFVQANGRFYTTKASNCFYNVSYSSSISALYEHLEANQDSIKSILEIDITDPDSTSRTSADPENNGKYLCDFSQKVVRVPQLNAMYVQATDSLSQLGTYIPSSLPNVFGMFKACYHLFNKNAKSESKQVFYKLIDDLKKMTSGIFDLEVSDIEKNYIETDLDLSNQNEKFDWLSMLGQVVGLNANMTSGTYQEQQTVNADSIRLIPYICCSTASTAYRRD